MQHLLVGIAQRGLNATCLHLTQVVVAGGGVARHAHTLENKILRVAIDIVHLGLQAMVAQGVVEQETSIQVVTALWLQVGIGFLYQSVAKHLDSLGHAVGALKTHLGLQRG